MLQRRAAQLRSPALILGGALLGALLVLIYLNVATPWDEFDEGRIAEIAQAQIASATPQPPIPPAIYGALRPAVVLIQVEGTTPDNTSFSGRGTGVVVDESGRILTSLHVVRGAQTVRVRFFDGSTAQARVASQQPERDLAIIEVPQLPQGIEPAILGGGVGVGDQVVAIGNPFGFEASMTLGIVSGLGRRFAVQSSGTVLEDLIQFDAAVNPGNSGGPLIDMSGRVVGIVTGIANPVGQSVFVGLGFAVPIQAAAGLVAPVQ